MKLNNRVLQSMNATPVYDCGSQSERHERSLRRVLPMPCVSKPRFLKPGTPVIATAYNGRATRTDVGTVVSTKDRYRYGV